MVITCISKAALQYTQHNTQMVGLINSTTRMTRGTSTIRVKIPINIRTDGKLRTIPTNRGSTTVCIEERTANIKTNNNIENSKGKMTGGNGSQMAIKWPRKMIIREETMFRLDFVEYHWLLVTAASDGLTRQPEGCSTKACIILLCLGLFFSFALLQLKDVFYYYIQLITIYNFYIFFSPVFNQKSNHLELISNMN